MKNLTISNGIINSIALNPPFIITPSLNWRFVLRILVILAVFLTFSLLAFYIFQINSLVSEKYLIQNYQKKIEKITQENENLQTQLATAGSLGNIENLIKELNFEKIAQTRYIQVLDTSVVKK